MNVLLIGSGGREHAIAKKIALNKNVSKIYCAPGNGGTQNEEKCENINIVDIDELAVFAKNNNIYLTVVGPEVPLIQGIVDKFKSLNLRIFGPCKKGAMLEGSKSFSKEFMKKYNVKTAKYEVFMDAEKAVEYLKNQEYPIVVKADGLAAGKGVYICNTFDEANKAVEEIMVEDIFNGAGSSIVIEEFLEGVEASILSITDGDSIIPFISAKDHKQIFDENKGPNTGGMGVLAPNPYVTDDINKEFEEKIMFPTLEGIKKEGFDFVGIIFFGIMITKKGTYLLEYNVRMGDPETQSVLSLMESDFFELLDLAVDKKMKNKKIKWKNEYCCNVVVASSGYPGKFEKGFPITVEESINQNVFIAGAKLDDKILKNDGGRVLCVVGLGKTREDAISKAYENISKIEFENMYYRKDIGK